MELVLLLCEAFKHKAIGFSFSVFRFLQSGFCCATSGTIGYLRSRQARMEVGMDLGMFEDGLDCQVEQITGNTRLGIRHAIWFVSDMVRKATRTDH